MSNDDRLHAVNHLQTALEEFWGTAWGEVEWKAFQEIIRIVQEIE